MTCLSMNVRGEVVHLIVTERVAPELGKVAWGPHRVQCQALDRYRIGQPNRYKPIAKPTRENTLHQVHTCSDCCTGITDDDWSWIDSNHGNEEADRLYAITQTALDWYGCIAHTDTTGSDEEFVCDVCERLQDQPTNLFLAE